MIAKERKSSAEERSNDINSWVFDKKPQTWRNVRTGELEGPNSPWNEV